VNIGTEGKETYLSGFSCGEAVAKVILDKGMVTAGPEIIKAASAFKTGIGGTKGDLCGCLLAGLMLVGVKYGRDNNQDDIADVNRKSAELWDRFKEKYGTLHCRELTKEFPMDDKERFMSSERKQLCSEIVKFVAQEVHGNIL